MEVIPNTENIHKTIFRHKIQAIKAKNSTFFSITEKHCHLGCRLLTAGQMMNEPIWSFNQPFYWKQKFMSSHYVEIRN